MASRKHKGKYGELDYNVEKKDAAMAVGFVLVAVVVVYFIAQIIRWAVR